jgi:hypothetical protein
MENWLNFRDIENSEFVGVAMRKVVYFVHALRDLETLLDSMGTFLTNNLVSESIFYLKLTLKSRHGEKFLNLV